MKWKMLPEPWMYHGPETAIALAFEPSLLNFSAHFELICAVTLPDQPFIFFEIYSSRSGWRVSNTFCYELDVLKLNNDGFYMKGFVFWKIQSQAVLAFDVKNEDYGIVNLPVLGERIGELTEMHGELCYLLPCKQGDAYAIEVYGEMDMKLKGVIPLNPEVVGFMSEPCRALHFVNDDTLIVTFGSNVVAYHARAQKAERLGNTRSDGYAKYLPYVNSLVHVGHPLVRA
uniref:F-box protein At5g49610-like n=1 Tax=Rhizophora mucronata TaxID=61149 RepID=A0A2P2P1K8_RHIMU